MENQNLYPTYKQNIESIRRELIESKKQNEKIKKALLEVFPVNLYRQIKELPEVYNEDHKVIDHFINHGIDEMNFKEIIKENINYLGLDIPRNQYHQIEEAAKLITLELTESKEREKERALKASAGCLRDSGIMNMNKLNNHSEIEGERILLKTQGNHANLCENASYQFAVNHTKVHYQSNSVCTWIPKNACSNIRCSIAIANGAIASVDEIEWIHANNDCFVASTKEILEAKFTFIVLRNPFKRLLSFFLDKLCHADEKQSDISYQIAKDVFEFNSSMSFEDFINHIWEYPHTIYEDEHTRPQTDFILYRNYDKYYAIEKLGEALEEINAKIGLEIYDTRNKNTIYTTKGHDSDPGITFENKAAEIKNLYDLKKTPIAKNMYDAEMIKKVAAIYLQDILLYASRIPDGMSELNYWTQRAF